MMDHRGYGGIPPQPEAALCQILLEAQHRWLRPTEVCEILRNYRKFKLTPDPPHKPQSGSLFLFDRKALRYFRKDGHNWRKKKDGKTVREAHERLKAGSVEVLHCYYAHGEDNENFQRRSYWMLDTHEHIVLVHYREVKEGNRSGMRSPNSYSVNGGSSLANSCVVAGSSPQTSPLVSPRSSSPNTSTDWNGRMYSPEYDEPESSDDTDKCLLQELESSLSEGLNGVAGVGVAKGRNLQACASFSARNQDVVGYEGKHSASLFNANGTALHQTVSQVEAVQTVPSRQDHGTMVPPGGFDLLEWCEVLKYGKNWGGKGSSVLSDRGIIAPSDWAGVLQQCTIPQHLNRGGTVTTSSVSASYGHADSKIGINESLGSIQGTIGPALQVVDAHRQSYPQCFAGSEPLVPSEVANKQNSNVVHWGAVLQQLGDNGHEQNGMFEGFESDVLNQTQELPLQFSQTYHEEEPAFPSQHELDRFDASGNKDASLLQSYSHVFKDFQADTPSQCEEHDTFKKLDSFGRWMSQEIGRDAEQSLLPVSSDSATYWASALEDQSTVEEVSSLAQQMQLDIGLIPLLSQEQCFSITDFSPDNAFSTTEVKVLITGTFRDTVKDPSSYNWCCMFGEVEVPAELLQPGVLRCRAPPHAPGRVPFYITRNDRVACSDVREFEFRTEIKLPSGESSVEGPEGHLNKRDMLFQIRLARMLSSGIHGASTSQSNTLDEVGDSNNGSDILNCYEEWEEMEDQLTQSGCLSLTLKEQFVQKLLKEKLSNWLSKKVLEGGKGGSVLDDHGLGVLHMGAALGYTWTIARTLAAGVNINFRDSRGWTALHWAAHCGREAMVVALLAAGAAPGAKTDPTNKFPAGQTPADLASIERHKGIAGYLAESSLTSHLSSLTLKSSRIQSIPAGLMGDIAVETVSERTIVQPGAGGSEDQLSLQDSLAAVRNAAQAAARIHSVFRVESFQKRQESAQLQKDEYGISTEQARYIVAAQKTHRNSVTYGDDEVSHSAAIRIQQKFRGWKGRKDFLIFRQRVVKIQAHFRGHQARKNYKKIIWSVGIVEKAILRWRRKGRGLRGFCADGSAKNGTKDDSLGSDGDDDFLKAGRKQTEEGLEKALARVHSMVRSPEAREQYRRLLESYPKVKVQFEGDAYDTSINNKSKERTRYSEDHLMSISSP